MVFFNLLFVITAFASIHAALSSIANLIIYKLHLHRLLAVAVVALVAPLALKLITGEWGYAYFGLFIFTLPQIAAFTIIYNKNSNWSNWFWRPFLSTVISFFLFFFVGL